MSDGIGVTTVVRVWGLPLWRWSTQKSGEVVAKGFAMTEKKAWDTSIAKAAKVADAG